MSDLNLEANMSQYGVTPYWFLMAFLDHFTRKINLTPLKRKSVGEVTEAQRDIFCESGPPSENGREFSNQILFTTLAERSPTIKLVYGKPRHPESQGAVERANRDVKDAVFSMMYDNGNDQCWVKYLRWVKFHKNITYHSTIKMSPFEGYNKKTLFGSNWGIPHELDIINTENYLNIFQKKYVNLQRRSFNQNSPLRWDENEFVNPPLNLMISQEAKFLSKYPYPIDNLERYLSFITTR